MRYYLARYSVAKGRSLGEKGESEGKGENEDKGKGESEGKGEGWSTPFLDVAL